MFARIFVVAAFLVLVAQGPTFSGKEAQVAASASPDGSAAAQEQSGSKSDVTVSQGSGSNADQKKVDETGTCSTEAEKQTDACKNRKEEERKKSFIDEKGVEKEICTTCGGTGMVSQGTGGSSNPGAVQQYASPTTAALSQVYTPPDDQTKQRIDAAFANSSQYIGGQGSPVSAQAVAQAQNNIPASVYSPQASGVQGTTLGYDGDLGGGKSIALNDNLYTNAAALSAQQQSQGGLQAVPAYIPPSTGATMAVPGAVSPIAAGFQAAAAQWDASQPLGGVSSGQAGAMSPSEVFFADAQQRLTPAAGGPVVTRFTSEQWSTFQASGQSLGQYVGTDYPIVVDFGIQGVSVLRGQDFGITTDGTINIAGVNADTSYMGNGTLQDKIAYTLSRTLDSTAVSGIMNSRNVETGTSLASAIGAEYAQAKSSETFTDSVYRFFTEHGEPRLTVTGSSLPPLGETAIVQGPSNAELAQMRSQDQPQEAATIAAAKDHPATVLGSDANTLGKIVVAGQDGTQSGRAPDRASPGGGGGGNVSQGARDGVGGQVAVGTSPSSQSGVESAGAQQSGFTLPPVEVDTTAAPQGTAASAGVQHGVLMVPESGLGPKVDLPSFPAGPELQARIAATQEDVDRTGKGGLYDFGGGVSLHLTPKNALPPIEGTVVASTPGFDTARSVDPQEVAAAVDVPASVHASEVSGPSVADTGPTDAQIAREAQGQTGAQVAESRPSGSSGQQTAEAKEDTRTWWERFLGITTPVPSPPEQLQRFAEYNAANPPTEQHSSAGFLGDFFGSAAEATPAQKNVQGVIARFQGIASCYDPLNKTSCGGTKFEGGLQIAGKGGTYLGNDIPTAALQLSKALATGCGVNGQDCVARVTNVATGRSVEVRINDNGPLFNGRVIDLNPAAKQAIGAGDLSNVRVEILGRAGGATLNAGVTRSGFQMSISATAPGQKPVEIKVLATAVAKPVSYGIGSTGSTIDQNSYINALCQPDRGCTAQSVGPAPSGEYPTERPITDAGQRIADYARQVADAGAQSKGNQPVDIDNCQHAGSEACDAIMSAIQKWNTVNPGKTLVPMIKNPTLIAEKLGAQEAARLMNAAGRMGGGAIIEPGAGNVAQNDALRKNAGVPNAALLFVGTQSDIAPFEQAIRSGNISNAGTSASDKDYKTGVTGRLPIALGGSAAPQGTVQKALAQYARDIAKQGITFGMPQQDGSVKLMSGKEAAALSVADREKLQAFKQIPLAQGIASAALAQGSFVKEGIRYSPMGSLEDVRKQVEQGAQDAVRRALQSERLNTDSKLSGVCKGVCDVRAGGDVYRKNSDGTEDKVGAVRLVTPDPKSVASLESRLTYRGGVAGMNPVIRRSMEEASKLLPAGYTVRVNNAARTGSTVGSGSFHLQRDSNGNALATDVTILDQNGNELRNIRSPQTFGVYRDFMQNVKAFQDQLYPNLKNLGRWGGYFVGGVGQDLMHYDLGPKNMMAAGSWEGGLLGMYAQYGMPGDVGKGMGPLNQYVLPSVAPYYEFTSTDGSITTKLSDATGVGAIAAKITDENGELGFAVEHTPPQEDTRSFWQKTQDYARNTWNSLTGNGGAQPYDAMRPAGNAQPAGGAGGGSGGGAQTQPSQQAKPQQPIPVMPSQQEVPTAPAMLTCSQSVVDGDASSKVSISWKCPAGTTPVGSGFSTVGSVSGSITVSVSTTSASIRYGIACSGTKTPQTASCTVKVLHPSVLLVAKPSSIPNGTAAHLEWSAKDVTSCALYAPPTVLLTTGGATGQATTLPLSQPTRFRIRCETGATPITNAVVVNLDTDAGTPVDTILP